jgi:hypothetical protein
MTQNLILKKKGQIMSLSKVIIISDIEYKNILLYLKVIIIWDIEYWI